MRAERFENRVALVTGAAQGIGRAVALQMAAEKARLLSIKNWRYQVPGGPSSSQKLFLIKWMSSK